MDKFIDIFGSTESVFIHDKNHQNQHERVKNWQSSLEVTTRGNHQNLTELKINPPGLNSMLFFRPY